MPKFIVFSTASYNLLKVVETENEADIEDVIKNNVNLQEYQEYKGERINMVVPMPEGYDLHEDALKKGYT